MRASQPRQLGAAHAVRGMCRHTARPAHAPVLESCVLTSSCCARCAGELLAVKELTVQDGEKGADAVEQLEQEVALLSSLSHPNIVSRMGTLLPGCRA